ETALAGYRPHLLGLPRKIRRGISLRETTLCGCPLRGHGFATPHQYFAVPVTALPRRVPNGKNPARVGLRLRFAGGETARAVIGPTGADVLAYPAFAPLKRGPAANNPHLIPHPLQREQQLVIHVERAPHAQAVYPVLRQPCFAHDLLYRARVHYIRYVFKNHPLTALCYLWERNCGTAAAS
ncbi:MAG: hypothetical protein ACLR7U_14565, partial [Ruthenibacterium lactatiformans]